MPDASGYSRHDAPPQGNGKAEGKRQSQREAVIETVLNADVAFWADLDGTAHATVPRGGQSQRYRVRSRRFGLLVRALYGEANPVPCKGGTRPGSVSDHAMTEVIPAFEAMALAGGTRVPQVRLLRHDGAIWLDLGGEDWQLVRVAADGWRVVEGADVPLIRPDGLRALPLPRPDPDALAKLRGLLNLGSDEDLRLVLAWLLAALFPEGPYPVLALDGEQGSGKSTVSRMLRRLVDPNRAEVRAPPRREDDLLIAAMNGRVVALDNMSFVDAEMADAICRLATGAGFSKRELYSDLNEVVVSVARSVLLNGIPSLLARGDLADRAIAVTLPPIPDQARQPEAMVWAEFDQAAPGILALLLDGLAAALRRLPGLRLDRLPRMADFARLACAAAPAFGWTEADMMAALESNREGAITAVLEADPLAEPVHGIAQDYASEGWTGTATQLLNVVNNRVPLEVKNERSWPKDGARLSARLKRVAPALRRAGVDVALPDGGGRAGRLIRIQQKGDQRSKRSSDGHQRSWNADSGPERSGKDEPHQRHNGAGNGRNAGNADLPLGEERNPAERSKDAGGWL